MEIRIEELQRGVADMLVQLDPVDAGCVAAAFRIIIPPHPVALIVEDLVADRAGQHVELRMRDVFRGERGGSPFLLLRALGSAVGRNG
jgi:hypothetical protein